MNVALLCLSGLLAMAWLPILLQFAKNWKGRSNPISLAICFIVAFAIYLCATPFLGMPDDPELAAMAMQAANAATCVFFHVSFGWARRKWSPEMGSGRARVTDYPTTVSPSDSQRL